MKTSKKISAALAACTAFSLAAPAVSVLPAAAEAQSQVYTASTSVGTYTVNKVVYTLYSDGTAVLSSLKDGFKLTSLAIPASVTTNSVKYKIIAIGDHALEGNETLKSVSMPSSLTSIGNSAFAGCTALASVSIPAGVMEIGLNAFENCTALTTAAIKANVSALPESMFEGCTALTSITWPSSVSTIGISCFENCTALKSITIPETVLNIQASAFEGCTSLSSVTFPDYEPAPSPDPNVASGLSLGSRSFANTGLTSLILPASLISLDSAFADCADLKSVELECIYCTDLDGLFKGCTSLQSVLIGDGFTAVAAEMFSGCTSLVSVKFPDSLETIASQAFYECSSLATAEFPESLKIIAPYAFRASGLTGNLEIPAGCTSLGLYSFYTDQPVNLILNYPSGTKVSFGNYSTSSYKLIVNNANSAIYGLSLQPYSGMASSQDNISVYHGRPIVSLADQDTNTLSTVILSADEDVELEASYYLGNSSSPSVLANATVWLDGEEAGTTDASGIMNLGKLETGSYSAAVENEAGILSAEFTFSVGVHTNSWLEYDLQIEGWTAGETPNTPSGCSSQYGETLYLYSSSEDGDYTAAVPDTAGTWWVKAVVEGTDTYSALEGSPVSFEIAPAASEVEPDTPDTPDISGGSWDKIDGNWYWIVDGTPVKDGIYTINNEKYAFDEDGVMLYGWQKIDNAWYYAGSSGALCTGWKKLNWNGELRWYYFYTTESETNPKCSMVSSAWLKSGGYWYYMTSSGAAAQGWAYLSWQGEKNWYYFTTMPDADHPECSMLADIWLDDYVNWYCFAPSGAAYTGWQTLYWDGAENEYYFYEETINGHPKCSMARNTVIDGKILGSSGAWTGKYAY